MKRPERVMIKQFSSQRHQFTNRHLNLTLMKSNVDGVVNEHRPVALSLVNLGPRLPRLETALAQIQLLHAVHHVSAIVKNLPSDGLDLPDTFILGGEAVKYRIIIQSIQ